MATELWMKFYNDNPLSLLFTTILAGPLPMSLGAIKMRGLYLSEDVHAEQKTGAYMSLKAKLSSALRQAYPVNVNLLCVSPTAAELYIQDLHRDLPGCAVVTQFAWRYEGYDQHVDHVLLFLASEESKCVNLTSSLPSSVVLERYDSPCRNGLGSTWSPLECGVYNRVLTKDRQVLAEKIEARREAGHHTDELTTKLEFVVIALESMSVRDEHVTDVVESDGDIILGTRVLATTPQEACSMADSHTIHCALPLLGKFKFFEASRDGNSVYVNYARSTTAYVVNHTWYSSLADAHPFSVGGKW